MLIVPSRPLSGRSDMALRASATPPCTPPLAPDYYSADRSVIRRPGLPKWRVARSINAVDGVADDGNVMQRRIGIAVDQYPPPPARSRILRNVSREVFDFKVFDGPVLLIKKHDSRGRILPAPVNDRQCGAAIVNVGIGGDDNPAMAPARLIVAGSLWGEYPFKRPARSRRFGAARASPGDEDAVTGVETTIIIYAVNGVPVIIRSPVGFIRGSGI